VAIHPLNEIDRLRSALLALGLPELDLPHTNKPKHTHWIPAAVLVLLQRGEQSQIEFVLTQRGAHLTAHGGQISFPGGRIEPSDASAAAAALRESHEEIGLVPDHVEPLGLLTPIYTGTGFRITPVVGLLNNTVNLMPASAEVAEVFTLPLDFVLDPNNIQLHEREWEGHLVRSHRVFYRHYDIWGATANIIADLVQRLRGA
jgi:8-oxo-dGTP pyrophosphatase MutT (NUDIX family)